MTSIRPEGCSNCGQFSLEPDLIGNSGTLNCTKCGYVAIENPMVSEVHYQESSNGATSVQGTMVAVGQARPNVGGRQNALDSREQTLLGGKRNIRDLAAALRIPDYISDAAFGWYRLAFNQNFVQGRRSQNVIAACLYVACRKEKTHHMLIDFSSKLQISVFSLGATFLKMVKALHIVKLPLADPSLFISHFAENLKFDNDGENGKIRVIKDAIQLAKRMSQDWIHEGRRPAGIAGACVLLAARMNGFRRANNEIVAVAHVAEETLQKRLKEFRDTHSSELSIKQFRENQSVEAVNPPSFIKGVKVQQRLKTRLERRPKELKIFKETIQGIVKESDDESEDLQPQPAEELSNDDSSRSSRRNKRSKRLSGLSSQDTEPEVNNPRKSQRIANKHDESFGGLYKNLLKDVMFTEEELNEHVDRIITRDEAALNNKVYITPSKASELDKRIEENKPRNLVKYLPTTQLILDKVNSSETLDDINLDLDDEEYFHDEQGRRTKEIVWINQNKDYLLEQERKRLKQEADELAGNTSANKHKNKRKRDKLDVVTEAGIDILTGEELTPEESAKRNIKRNYSSKINYNIVDKLKLGQAI